MRVNKSGVDGKLIQMFQRSSSHLIKLQLRGVWWRDTKEKETGEPAGELRVEDPAIFLLWREDPTAFHAVLSSRDIQTAPMTCLAHDLNGDRMCSKLTQCMLVKNKAGFAVVSVLLASLCQLDTQTKIV